MNLGAGPVEAVAEGDGRRVEPQLAGRDRDLAGLCTRKGEARCRNPENPGGGSERERSRTETLAPQGADS